VARLFSRLFKGGPRGVSGSIFIDPRTVRRQLSLNSPPRGYTNNYHGLLLPTVPPSPPLCRSVFSNPDETTSSYSPLSTPLYRMVSDIDHFFCDPQFIFGKPDEVRSAYHLLPQAMFFLFPHSYMPQSFQKFSQTRAAGLRVTRASRIPPSPLSSLSFSFLLMFVFPRAPRHFAFVIDLKAALLPLLLEPLEVFRASRGLFALNSSFPSGFFYSSIPNEVV